MNLASVSLAYLRSRPLSTALVIVLLALGIGTITLVMLVTAQLEDRMQRDARGIDLVVGAKGSPLQIILSAIYQLDVPTGNIPLTQAREIAQHRAVKQAIPLAMGDSVRGWRIVGTRHDYLAHYGAQPAAGRLWEKPMEAVLGAEVAAATGLTVGATFAGAHGISDAGGAEHGETPYVVVGVLARNGSVVDRLVLTAVESVWAVHEEHHGAAGHEVDDSERELTALLVRYASPLAAAILPRYVNANSQMQAASPAWETARLFSIVGVATDVLRAFALVLVLSAGLSVFVALYHALEERRYDLAIMRTLGASRGRVMTLMLFEAVLLALAGAAIGIAAGHLAAEAVGHALRAARQVEITGWLFLPEVLWLFALAAGVGVLAGALPAWRAYRTDIARTLAQG